MWERLYMLVGSLGVECSLYDAYILPSKTEALWYFLWLVLGGLAGALFLRQPEKE